VNLGKIDRAKLAALEEMRLLGAPLSCINLQMRKFNSPTLIYDIPMQNFSQYISSQNSIANKIQNSLNLDILINSIWELARDSNSIVFTIGNGGSASTAEHFSADLGQMEKRTGQAVRSFCLNSQIALSSAFANDYEYSSVIARQLSAFKNSNYILVTFSASGRSKNILEAIKFSLEAKKEVHCFIGFNGGEIISIKNANVIHFPDPKQDYGIAENLHLTASHYIVDRLVEKFKGIK
jgi:D-sedoheptulose 7-phosphate isomerase